MTLRATDAFAPVVVRRGAMGNAVELVVGQHQRMFLFGRPGAARHHAPTRLVEARDLVDDVAIRLRPGGHAEYSCLCLKHSEIIYDEGTPIESLSTAADTLKHLPGDLWTDLRRHLGGRAAAAGRQDRALRADDDPWLDPGSDGIVHADLSQPTPRRGA